ncbi:hypothetical protein EVAR_2631_1 [Eumeta japonica]|uniref:Uncharacterized protein n=1 Tax=Eumeta variegata TaxID=151549 RepID=A0A4C1SPD4_EUMVA|nr:hypothetical protein EVAR_2631_1 [Eumeta japonica]
MGLLQTPVPVQRFEVVAVNLFGPLPKKPKGELWVLIVEDTASLKQNVIPEANPVEGKNRKLKIQLAIFVERHHNQWPEVLSFTRLIMNTALTKATQRIPAYLTYGRELHRL